MSFKVGDKVWVTSDGVVEKGELARPAVISSADPIKWSGTLHTSYRVESPDDSFVEQGWSGDLIFRTKEEAHTAGRDICSRLVDAEVRRHQVAIARLAAVDNLA